MRVQITVDLFFCSRILFGLCLKKPGVCDAIQPGGKTRLAAELVQLAPGGQKCLLREIVRRGEVAAHQAAQLGTHSPLVAANKFPESMLIIDKSATEERL